MSEHCKDRIYLSLSFNFTHIILVVTCTSRCHPLLHCQTHSNGVSVMGLRQGTLKNPNLEVLYGNDDVST